MAFDADGAFGCHAMIPEQSAGVVVRNTRIFEAQSLVVAFIVAVGLFVDDAREAFVGAHGSESVVMSSNKEKRLASSFCE